MCGWTVVAFLNHVESPASDAKLGQRARSIRPFRSISDAVENSSNTTRTTGVFDFTATFVASAVSSEMSFSTGEPNRNSARKTSGAGARNVSRELANLVLQTRIPAPAPRSAAIASVAAPSSASRPTRMCSATIASSPREEHEVEDAGSGAGDEADEELDREQHRRRDEGHDEREDDDLEDGRVAGGEERRVLAEDVEQRLREREPGGREQLRAADGWLAEVDCEPPGGRTRKVSGRGVQAPEGITGFLHFRFGHPQPSHPQRWAAGTRRPSAAAAEAWSRRVTFGRALRRRTAEVRTDALNSRP